MGRALTERTVKSARETFLEALAKRGNITESAAAAGVARRTVYQWRDADPEFASAWDDALEQAADAMEAELWRRAVEGVEKPIYQQGMQVGTVREYSDTLLIFRLKGARPEVYRERIDNRHSGSVDLKGLSDDELRRIAEG